MNYTGSPKKIAMALAALASLTMATGAQARDAAPFQTNERHIVVPFKDLNLLDEGGKKLLDQRLKLAARKSCGPQSSRGLRDMANHRACYDRALANAMQARDTVLVAAQRDGRMRADALSRSAAVN